MNDTSNQGNRPHTPPLSDPPGKGQRDDQPLKELNETPEDQKQPGQDGRDPQERRDGR